MLKSSRNNSAAIDANNIIGKGTTVTGDLHTEGNIRIDGEVHGNVSSKMKVALGKGSVVHGNISSQSAEIEGNITGDMTINEMLILKATATITGNVSALRLLTEPGAKIYGQCHVGEAPKKEISSHTTKSIMNGKQEVAAV